MDVLSIKFLSASFIFFSAGLSLLLCIGQLAGRKRYVENYVLASYLFFLSLIFFQICLILNDIYRTYPQLLYFHMTALYFMAPIVYSADYLVILPVPALSRAVLLLFTPVLIGLAADIWYIAMPYREKIALLQGLFSGDMTVPVLTVRIIIAGSGLQMIVYLAFLLKKLLSNRQKDENFPVLLLMVISIFVVAGLSVIIILGYFLGSYSLLRWGANLTGLLVICAFLVSQRYPKILQFIMFETEKKYAGRSLLGQIDVPSLVRHIDRLMEQERLYADDQLTLHDLADELSITPHQLSQLLNERMNTNFNALVNQHRVRAAQDILVNEPDKTVLAVSLEVGFNSKSAFYEAFARFTGMSPQNFRKRKSSQ